LKSTSEKLECAEPIINDFLNSIGQNKSACTKSATSADRFLTENEEKAIVWIAKIACAAGLGLTREDLLNIINEYQWWKNRWFGNACYHGDGNMYYSQQWKWPWLYFCKLTGPKKSKTGKHNDAWHFFCKTWSIHRNASCRWQVPWSHFKDIPNECLYNMDELATDTTKHKQKVLGDKQNRSRTFIIIPEGDGKMNHHVTVCLMLRADGMCFIVECVDCCVRSCLCILLCIRSCLCELLHTGCLTDWLTCM